MRPPSNVLGFAVLLLAVARVGAAAAQAEALQGSYVYDAAGSDDVARAIDAVVARMNFITRPIARGRLTRTNVPARRVAIALRGDEVHIAIDGGAPVVTPASGEPVVWRRDDGELLDVGTTLAPGRIEQTFVAADGRRTNVYTLEPDGRTLRLRVTVTSPRLPEPLLYTLRFRRSD